MTKLVERESVSRASPLAVAPSLAVQFFLIPMAVVGMVVLIYGGFRLLVADERSAQDYLNDIRSGGRERRWPAAFGLSRLMADPELQARDPMLGSALVRAFEEARGDDPRVRRYLALAIGRLNAPPPDAVPRLVDALDDPDSETRISVVWALAELGNPSAVPQLEHAYQSDDAGVRKVVVYVLGALPGDAQIDTLRTALADHVVDVRWNAALALARHGHAGGVPVLRRMLDREFVERAVSRTADATDNADPVDEIMISSLRALIALDDASARGTIATLSEHDVSLKVREVAREALDQLEPLVSSLLKSSQESLGLTRI